MKSSVVPFAAGAMTVLGVWMVASNKKKIDKIVKNVSDTMNQMLQTCKKTLQEDSCTCNSQNYKWPFWPFYSFSKILIIGTISGLRSIF